MTAIVQYPEGTYTVSGAQSISASNMPFPIGETSTVNTGICFVKKGLSIPVSGHEKGIQVRQTFYILLAPTEEGFVATSPIADVYEVELLVRDAVRNYLYSLADELLWLEERKDSLSDSMLKQLYKLQLYIGFV